MTILSRRGRILTALIKQLQTISTTNGYATTINEASTELRNWRDRPEAECPVIFVVDNRTAPKYNAGKTLEVTWHISLFGFMRNRSQMEMEELIADIELCLDKNRQLSFDGERGLVNHHRVTDIVTDNQMFSEIEGSQIFRVDLEILYTRCVDDPR
jgi:hypothetical protein